MSTYAEKNAAETGASYQAALKALPQPPSPDEWIAASGAGTRRRGQESLWVQVDGCERKPEGTLVYAEYVVDVLPRTERSGDSNYAVRRCES